MSTVLFESIGYLGWDDNFTYLKGSKKLSKSEDFDLKKGCWSMYRLDNVIDC